MTVKRFLEALPLNKTIVIKDIYYNEELNRDIVDYFLDDYTADEKLLKHEIYATKIENDFITLYINY